MSTVTTSMEAHILPPVYFLLFLVLVGFTYHLIRNKGYKDTLLASIIIGLIFGLIFNTSLDLVKTLTGYLIYTILVIVGGFLSVSLKKLVNSSITDHHDTPAPEALKTNWWDKQNPKFKSLIIIIACLLSLILITSSYSLANPVKDPVQLTLHFDSNSSEINLEETLKEKYGNYIVISKNATKFKLMGSSEPNAAVKFTVNEFGIYNQTIQLDPNSNFEYNLSIPQNVSLFNVTVGATKPGKKSSDVTLIIKR